MTTPATRSALVASALRKSGESADVQRALLAENGERLAACAEELARKFAAGGRLFVMGNGGSACDAQHVAVEFMHPILEKRKAWPAYALSNDQALLTAVGNDRDFSTVFAGQLRTLAHPGDVALGISSSGEASNVVRALSTAREMGLSTVLFAGRDGGRAAAFADHAFVAPSFSIHRIQEAHVLLLHLLWDLVHVAAGEEDVLG